jgi:hypothetical protein
MDGKSARLVIGDQIPSAIAGQTQTPPDKTTQPVILTHTDRKSVEADQQQVDPLVGFRIPKDMTEALMF